MFARNVSGSALADGESQISVTEAQENEITPCKDNDCALFNNKSFYFACINKNLWEKLLEVAKKLLHYTNPVSSKVFMTKRSSGRYRYPVKEHWRIQGGHSGHGPTQKPERGGQHIFWPPQNTLKNHKCGAFGMTIHRYLRWRIQRTFKAPCP